MLNFPSLAPNHHLACIHPSNEIHHGPQLVSRISFHNMDYWNDIFSVSVISKNVSFVYFLSPHWMFLAVFWLLATKLGSKFREFFGKNGVPRDFNSHSWNGFRKTKPRGLGIRSIVESAELSRGAGWPWISCSWFANDNWRDMVVLLLLLLKNLGIRRNQARSSTYAFMLWEHKPCKKNIERTHFGGSNLVARICVRPFRCESPAVVLEVVGLEGRCWVEIT